MNKWAQLANLIYLSNLIFLPSATLSHLISLGGKGISVHLYMILPSEITFVMLHTKDYKSNCNTFCRILGKETDNSITNTKTAVKISILSAK